MEKAELAKALAEFQAEMPDVKLDKTVNVKMKTGGSYDFKYATLQNIIKTVFPVSAKHGLSVVQTFGKQKLLTHLLHSSGQKIVSILPIDLETGSMQDIGSRISYLKRYAISALLCVVADEDDDANIDAGNPFTSATTKTKNKPPLPVSSDAKHPKGTNYKFLKTMKAIKARIVDADGNADMYYKKLGGHGVKKSNEVTNRDVQVELYDELRKYAEEQEQALKIAEDDIPY